MQVYGTRYLRKGNEGDEVLRMLFEDKHPFSPLASLGPFKYWSYEDTKKFYSKHGKAKDWSPSQKAFIGANDRFFLLTSTLGRLDADHPWLFERCREVEEEPDDYLDLWARYHYKSTIITFAGSIQEIIRDPNIAIGIFSNTSKIAQKFLDQIKREIESNSDLKSTYPDVFYPDPRKQSPQWSASEGIIVRRTQNRKEPTVGAYGVMDALPTGSHFPLMIFNDIVTHESVTTTQTDQIGKTTERWEQAQNLGVHKGGRKWHEGTRYHYADTYSVIIERQALKVRLYPATDNGRMTGTPVFLTDKKWQEIMRDQRSTIAAQQLLNPLAGAENTFMIDWLHFYEVRPRLMNVYILIDPSKGRTKRSDRSALVVVGIDPNGNRYFLDGYCHRMKLSRRWEILKELWFRWSKMPGVQMVRIGYERYGMQTDLETLEENIIREKIEGISIEEVNWVNEGPQAKNNRIERLEPYFRNSQFFMPMRVFTIPDGGAHACACFWEPDLETGMISFTPSKGMTKLERQCIANAERHRLTEPIRRIDEDGKLYDLTRVFFEEYRLQPFAPHDDLLDATSRIQDMEPTPPQALSKADADMGIPEDA